MRPGPDGGSRPGATHERPPRQCQSPHGSLVSGHEKSPGAMVRSFGGYVEHAHLRIKSHGCNSVKFLPACRVSGFEDFDGVEGAFWSSSFAAAVESAHSHLSAFDPVV